MFKKFNLIFIYALLNLFYCSQALSEDRTPKIVGGRAADTGAWPWMVTLSYNQGNEPFCGATLIAKDWVLTAAHCVINQTINSISVVTPNQTNTAPLPIKKIIVHPLYDAEIFNHDLALIQLIKPSQIVPIQLLSAHTTQDKAKKSAIALGWGTVSATKAIYPTALQQIELSIIDSASCATFMGDITENMLCAGDMTFSKDTCQGDSGGPLIVFDSESNSWRQAGITSWGFDCVKVDTYGIYTKVKNYTAFISKTICGDKKPSPPSLGLTVKANLVTASWSKLKNVSGYRLHYAPFSEPETVYSIDMNKATQFSIKLPSGSAYYVSINSYVDNCLSDYSNIGAFKIK